jgi:hypothetical protein
VEQVSHRIKSEQKFLAESPLLVLIGKLESKKSRNRKSSDGSKKSADSISKQKETQESPCESRSSRNQRWRGDSSSTMKLENSNHTQEEVHENLVLSDSARTRNSVERKITPTTKADIKIVIPPTRKKSSRLLETSAASSADITAKNLLPSDAPPSPRQTNGIPSNGSNFAVFERQSHIKSTFKSSNPNRWSLHEPIRDYSTSSRSASYSEENDQPRNSPRTSPKLRLDSDKIPQKDRANMLCKSSRKSNFGVSRLEGEFSRKNNGTFQKFNSGPCLFQFRQT